MVTQEINKLTPATRFYVAMGSFFLVVAPSILFAVFSVGSYISELEDTRDDYENVQVEFSEFQEYKIYINEQVTRARERMTKIETQLDGKLSTIDFRLGEINRRLQSIEDVNSKRLIPFETRSETPQPKR